MNSDKQYKITIREYFSFLISHTNISSEFKFHIYTKSPSKLFIVITFETVKPDVHKFYVT